MLVHVQRHLAVQYVVEQRNRMDAAVVHVNRGEEQELGFALRELERHRMDRGSSSSFGGFELEDSESIIAILWEVVPYVGGNAKALIEAFEILGPRYE